MTKAEELKEKRAALLQNRNKKMEMGEGLMNASSVGANGIAKKLFYIPFSDLKESLENYYSISKEKVEQLAQNISMTELQQPFVVSPKGADGKYEIIAGHTRFEAIKLLMSQKKWVGDTIPCLISDAVETLSENFSLSIVEAKRLAITLANEQREKTDADKYEESRILTTIIENYKREGITTASENGLFEAGEDLSGKTREIVARKSNQSASQVGKMATIRNQGSNSLHQALLAGRTTINTANEIAKLDHIKQEQLVSETTGTIDARVVNEFQRKYGESYQLTELAFKHDIDPIGASLRQNPMQLTEHEKKTYDKAIRSIKTIIYKEKN